MRKSYRTLAIMATLAILAAAIRVLLVEGRVMEIVSQLIGPVGSTTASRLFIIVPFFLGVASLTIATFVTVTLVSAAVLAAQTGRKGWLAAIIVAGLIVVYWQYVIYAPFYLSLTSEEAQSNLSWLPGALVYGQAAVSIVALSLALGFALREGGRVAPAPEAAVG